MKSSRLWMMTSCAAGALCLVPAALSQTPAKPAAPPKGEAMVASVEVTLNTDDGEEYSFIAGDAVKNLAQVKKGDIVTSIYTEALAYEVKKGDKGTGAATTVAAGAAEPGAKPAGAIARQTTLMVTITAIDPKVPSVTFKGPAGNTRTIKVRYPEKLQGVNVGDTVEITYTEALAMKVEKAPKK